MFENIVPKKQEPEENKLSLNYLHYFNNFISHLCYRSLKTRCGSSGNELGIPIIHDKKLHKFDYPLKRNVLELIFNSLDVVSV